jgi:putative ABC transport system substrate-binding protein
MKCGMILAKTLFLLPSAILTLFDQARGKVMISLVSCRGIRNLPVKSSFSRLQTILLRLHILLFAFLMLATPALAEGIKVGVAWAGKSGMTRRVAKGLEETLSARAPHIQVEWQRELTDIDALAKISKRFQREKAGMAILRSSGAKYLAKNPPSIPSFIGGCNHPVKLGVLNNMDDPEGNVTGVTYAVSFERQFEAFTAIIRQMKSVLLLMEEGHPSVPIDRKETKAICKKLNIEYNENVCSSKNEALDIVREKRKKVSVIIIGNHGLIVDSAKEIVAEAEQTPVISYTIQPVFDGALCGLTADDVKLGRMLGDSLIDVLVKGKAINEVPVKVDPHPQLYVNMKTAEKIGVIIPFNVLAVAKIIQ